MGEGEGQGVGIGNDTARDTDGPIVQYLIKFTALVLGVLLLVHAVAVVESVAGKF